MLHYDLIIDSNEEHKKIEISIFSMPVLDSRMYILPLSELLIIDPILLDKDDEPALRALLSGFSHATALVTHSHYDHIAGLNHLRGLIPLTVYTTPLCDKKLQNAHKNLAAYSMALVMGKTEERQRYCEECFDFNYSCQADETYDDVLDLTFRSMNGTNLTIHAIPTPGHSDCSQCIELRNDDALIAVFTGDSLVNGHDVITRFPTGNKNVYRRDTLPYLRQLPDDVTILPGHGDPALLSSLRDYAEA